MNTLTPPLKPTWRRYIRIFHKNRNISIYRALEYEALSRIEYSGRILDFGGGAKAHYVDMLQSIISEGAYESANISAQMEPTYLLEVGKSLPLKTESFDMVLSVNTLEHVYNLESVLAELTRALKPCGRIVFAVPFLYRVHGCPDDYNRPTASWWSEKLSELGFSNLRIMPLVWDPITSGLSVCEGVGPLVGLRRILVPLYGLTYGFIKASKSDEFYPKTIGDSLANFALGYVITGEKRA